MNTPDLIGHFDKRSSSYDKKGLWVHDPSVMAITIEFLDLVPHQRIIDVGAGTAAALENALLACPSLDRCVALDLSEQMLSTIRNVRIEKRIQDAHALPFPDASFDIALCRQVLHYLQDIDHCLDEINRVLAPKGNIVIGQITPFSEKDELWWKRILYVRQPLRRHLLTLNDIITMLLRHSFVVVRVSQIRAKESLNSWLERYQDSQEQLDTVRTLHLSAPPEYQDIHRFQEVNGDLLFDNCWTFIRACKSSYFDQ